MLLDGVLVASGGVLGGLLRVLISTVVGRLIGEHLPWGTFAVNVSGTFAIGLAAGAVSIGSGLWLFLAIGVLGSYTTVSTFSLQTLFLLEQRAFGRATINAGGSIVGCLLAATAGLALAGH